jgi:hypothetical protein
MKSVEMPRYKSHKEVWALKIKSIVRDGEGENRESDGSAIIAPEEEGYAPFRVEGEYMHKHKPQVGGYYVVYKDGYKSFSPADAFEEDNTLIKETTFLERLINEEKELAEKIVALGTSLNTYRFSDMVGKYQFELLSLQHSCMCTYRHVLNMTIDNLK